MSLARSTWSSRRASRPSSRIFVRRLPSCSWTTDSAFFSGFLLMGLLLSFVLGPLRRDAELLAELLLCVRVLEEVGQQRLQLVVAVGLGEDVAQLLPRLHELPERLHLLYDLVGLEVEHVVELQLDVHLAPVVGQLVVDAKSQARRLRREDLVEVVAVDFDQLPVLQPRKRLRRLPREVAEDAD